MERKKTLLIEVKIKKHCKENDIKLTDFALSLKVSKQSIYAWFRGTSIPKKATREKLEEIGVTCGDFTDFIIKEKEDDNE